jgi:hypothetical protein
MFWYEPINPNQTTTMTVEEDECHQTDLQEKTLTHRKWMDKSTSFEQHHR